MKKPVDIRYRILEELQSYSAETVSLNEFLSTIRTHNNDKDFGTIRRCLVDLGNQKLIAQFKNQSSGKIDYAEALRTDMYKTNAPKTTDRFLNDVVIDGDTYLKIPELYIYSTLEGKKFFIEWKKSVEETKNVKRRNNVFPFMTGAALISALVAVLSFYDSSKNTERIQELEDRVEKLNKLQPPRENTIPVFESIP